MKGQNLVDGVPIFAKITIPLIILLMASAVAWTSFAEIDEITRGQGKVIPATKTQVVQATEAGVVKEILVRIGQVVEKGDLIIRLDDTTTTSNLGESVAKFRALKARLARLNLEQTGNYDTPYQCPEELVPSSTIICENEAKLFISKRDNYRNKLAVLKQRLVQREREMGETKANIKRFEGSLALSKSELSLLQPLAKRGLVAKTELIRVQKDVNEFGGQLNLTRESVEKIKGAISEATLQMKELGLQLQQNAFNEKTEALAEMSVLEETVRGGANRVARTDIRSPVDGIINSLTINTIGSFVQPGSPIAEIVPTSEELLIEAQISPRDIAFVLEGLKAKVNVTAYDFSIYGGLDAIVTTVTADSIVDQQSGETYFYVRVKTNKSYLEYRGKQFQITPGMICSVDIITGKKTILHYLLKPLNKARQEALTER